jgi:hypothetical protein
MSVQDFILPVLVTLLGSGLWTFLIELIKLRSEKASAEKKMLLGLGHDVLYQRLTYYIDRGYIEPAELQNVEYVFRPYVGLGGNGIIKVLYEHVCELPTEKEKKNRDK